MFEHFANEPDLEWLLLDSSVVRAHACAAGASKKNGGQAAQAPARAGVASAPRFTSSLMHSRGPSGCRLTSYSPEGNAMTSPKPQLCSKLDHLWALTIKELHVDLNEHQITFLLWETISVMESQTPIRLYFGGVAGFGYIGDWYGDPHQLPESGYLELMEIYYQPTISPQNATLHFDDGKRETRAIPANSSSKFGMQRCLSKPSQCGSMTNGLK
jgi:hypothetical protein